MGLPWVVITNVILTSNHCGDECRQHSSRAAPVLRGEHDTAEVEALQSQGFRDEIECEREDDGRWLAEVWQPTIGPRVVREAIEFHLGVLREDGFPIPAPSSAVRYIDIAA